MDGESAYTVRVHEEDGSLWAEVVELPGVFAAGDTMDELLESLAEAIEMVLDIKVTSHRWEDNDRVEERQLLVSPC